MTLITAIITTHKREPEIVARALDSILAQTYAPIEIIVVDDSPADYPQRYAVCQLAAQRGVKYIAHETCQGACAARNTGLAAAHGEYVAFLDDDDAWLPQKIQKQLERFSDDIALVYCGNNICNLTTGTTIAEARVFLRGNVYDELIKGNFIGSTSFPLLRKSCLDEIGGFDILMQAAQDYDVWLRLAEKYSVDYVDEPLAMYYEYEGERITNNPKKRIAGLERLNHKNEKYLKKHRGAYWIRNIRLVPLYAMDKKIGKAFTVWMRAIIWRPWEVKENLRNLFQIFCAIFKK